MFEHKLRVLVADDAELVRWALERALRAEGFDVSSASSRSEVLGRLIAATFDVLVVSVSFGRENIHDLVEQVCRHCPSTGLILLADHTEIDDVKAECAVPCGRGLVVFEKPFDLHDVVSTVRRFGAVSAPARGMQDDRGPESSWRSP